MSSPGGPGMLNGQILPQIHRSMTSVALSIFGAKPEIELTGVRGIVRESLASWLI